jgi:hypothetical protein
MGGERRRRGYECAGFHAADAHGRKRDTRPAFAAQIHGGEIVEVTAVLLIPFLLLPPQPKPPPIRSRHPPRRGAASARFRPVVVPPRRAPFVFGEFLLPLAQRSPRGKQTACLPALPRANALPFRSRSAGGVRILCFLNFLTRKKTLPRYWSCRKYILGTENGQRL